MVSESLWLKIQEQQQAGATDEAEPFMGSGRFGMFSMQYKNCLITENILLDSLH